MGAELADIHMGAERGGPGEASRHFNSVWTELQELRAGSRRMYEDSA